MLSADLQKFPTELTTKTVNKDSKSCGDHLQQTIRLGHPGRVSKMLNKHGCSSLVDLYHSLHTATSYKQIEVAKLLITKYKCPVDCRNESKETPLHIACRKGYLNFVRMLMEKGADPKADDEDNNTPLHLAALNGNANAVICLIDEFKCNPNIKGSQGTTILHQACSAGHVELVETLLINYKLNPMSVDDYENTPLHVAALFGIVEIVKLLITKYNCPVDCTNKFNVTPLHCACSKGHLNAVKLLVTEHNAIIDARDCRNNTPLHTAASKGHTDTIKCLVEEFNLSPSIAGHEGSNILHIACNKGNVELAETSITHYHLDPLSVDNNGNTPLHFAALSGNEEVANLLITKFKCPLNCRNKRNESPFDLACANNHQNIIKLMKSMDEGIEGQPMDEIEVESEHLLPMIPREGHICAAQFNICTVQLPSDSNVSIQVDSVDDVTLHPKLQAKEFLLTPVVRISSDTKVFSPNKQAVIELLKTTELHNNKNKPIPMFSDTHPSQPPQWKDLNPDDLEVLQDRIVFNTTHSGLFTVVTRLPSPTKSVKINLSRKAQEPIKLTLLEVPNLKVVIPPSSFESESETELKITANFDHPSLCEESIDATACITLEPYGLQFKEKIPITIPIPDYAQITEMYSNAKLQFLHSTSPVDSTSVTWEESEYEIIKEGDQYVGLVYCTHFSSRKAIWLNIPKKIKMAIQGPIHAFRNWITKRFLKRFSGRCQVFMSREIVVGNLLTFGIAAVLHPLQECDEILKNYEYELCDSEKTPLVVKGSSVNLTVELDDHYCSNTTKKFCEEVELSGDFKARADFKIQIDSNIIIADEAILGTFSVGHGEVIAHKMTLIKQVIS